MLLPSISVATAVFYRIWTVPTGARVGESIFILVAGVRKYVAPVVYIQHNDTALHCGLLQHYVVRVSRCPDYVTTLELVTELVSLGWRMSTDNECAGCRRVEREVYCEEHTYVELYDRNSLTCRICISIPPNASGSMQCFLGWLTEFKTIYTRVAFSCFFRF